MSNEHGIAADPGGAPAHLAVERALRAAARAGNGLLAAATVRVTVSDPAARALLVAALGRMGARLAAEGAGAGAACDYAFVDAIGSDDRDGRIATVGLDGAVRRARGADADARIAWAAAGLRATRALAADLAHAAAPAGAGGGRPAAPPRVAVSLVLEPKTAAFARILAAAGCEVAVFSAVTETDPAVAAALAAGPVDPAGPGSPGRIAVFAPTAPVAPEAAAETDAAHAAAVLAWRPDLLVDDGAHLIRLAHTEHPEALAALRGAAEETTSGVRPLREMAARGELRLPVIAVNDARTKTGFDNRVGTGQSCVFAIADLLDAAGGATRAGRGVRGTRWAVIGYGPVGEGVARFAAALGARVTVVERDPVRALAALHDGHEARPLAEALAAADAVVSATGVWHTLTAEHLAGLRPGTVVAVAGGIDDELALDDLRAAGRRPRPVAPGLAGRVEAWPPPGGERGGPVVLAGGGGVNYTAGEGNPVEIMDLSFATQVAALLRLLAASGGGPALAPGVHVLAEEDERRVARAALSALGGAADPDPGPERGSAAADAAPRPGGAAQPWRVHRYRRLDSSE